MACGRLAGIVVLDFDGSDGTKLFEEKFAGCDRLPAHARTPKGGFHLFFKFPEDELGGRIQNAVRILPGLDVRTQGGYIVAPGTQEGREWVIHPTGEWKPLPQWFIDLLARLNPNKIEPEKMDEEQLIAGMMKDFEAIFGSAVVANADGSTMPITPRHKNGFHVERLEGVANRCAAIRRIIERADTERHLDHGQRIAIANLASCFDGGLEWLEERVLSNLSDYDPAYTRKQLASLVHKPPLCSSLCTEPCGEIEFIGGGKTPMALLPDHSHFHIGDGLNTDDGNARRLVRKHGRDIRFCNRFRSWYCWDGQRWRQDDRREVQERAKHTARDIYREAATATSEKMGEYLQRWAKKSCAKPRITAMIDLSTSDPKVAITPDDFDRAPHLLNVLNGTIDLKTGNLRPHDRSDMITKLIPVKYDPNARAPKWKTFLDRIMDGRVDVIEYLQRAVGYSLTGDIGEQVFLVLHGTGANGKSTFLQALLHVFADYGHTAGFATFITGRNSNEGGDLPRSDIADLAWKRFVCAIESNADAKLDETTIKRLTGGDSITVRRLYQEPFTFLPTAKIWLAVNHKPRIHGTDEAIWRRVHLVPFEVVIPQQERDTELLAKLKEEEAGILMWAIEGCLKWQKQRLAPPPAVLLAQQQWREDADPLNGFIGEWAEIDHASKVKCQDLRKAYDAFAIEVGEGPLGDRAFWTRLDERGLIRNRGAKGVRYRTGIRLTNKAKEALGMLDLQKDLSHG